MEGIKVPPPQERKDLRVQLALFSGLGGSRQGWPDVLRLHYCRVAGDGGSGSEWKYEVGRGREESHDLP